MKNEGTYLTVTNLLNCVGKYNTHYLFYMTITDTLGSCRGRSRTAATSKVELFVITVNGFQPLTIITKISTLDAAAVLDPPPSCRVIGTLGTGSNISYFCQLQFSFFASVISLKCTHNVGCNTLDIFLATMVTSATIQLSDKGYSNLL